MKICLNAVIVQIQMLQVTCQRVWWTGDDSRKPQNGNGTHSKGEHGIHSNGENGIYINDENMIHSNGENGIHSNGANEIHSNRIDGIHSMLHNKNIQILVHTIHKQDVFQYC